MSTTIGVRATAVAAALFDDSAGIAHGVGVVAAHGADLPARYQQRWPPQRFRCVVFETDKHQEYRVLGRYCLNLRDRMAGIAANLDDLQAGVEAFSRAADTLQSDTTKLDGLLNAPLFRAVVRHVKELQACARDQRAALQELRDGISRLQEELTRSPRAVKPPPLAVPEGAGEGR